ncbi:MAG TPA: hypothetical protein VKH17_05660 [Acidimicrobiia bacterium]|nr:hypothetical protein [Acidimicrobiia bacterium]
MKKMLVSLVAAGSLAIPVGWVTAASAKPAPDPDANGDVHSNCHTGSKGRGAGGEDAGPGNPKDTSDDAHCAAVPPPGPPGVTPGVTPVRAPGAAAGAAAQGAAVPTAGAAAAVQGVPRTTG